MLQNLFEFIASNFVIVLVILGGLFSFFQDKKKKEAEAEKRSRNPQTQQRGQQNGQRREMRPERSDAKPAIPELRRMQRSGNNRSQESAAREKQVQEVGSLVLEETNKLLERAKKTEHKVLPERERVVHHSKPVPKRNRHHALFRDGLNRKKLAQSIVMSEVLGPPRAVKPHAPGRQSRQH